MFIHSGPFWGRSKFKGGTLGVVLIAAIWAIGSVARAGDDSSDDDGDQVSCVEGPTTGTLLNNFVEFLGASFHADTNTTTFNYRVTSEGATPPLNFFVLGVHRLDAIVSVSPSPASHIGEENFTGVHGVLFNGAIPPNQSRDYSVTLTGLVAIGTVKAGGKSGHNIGTIDIAGPNTDCPVGPTPTPVPTPQPPCDPGPDSVDLKDTHIQFEGAVFDAGSNTTTFTYVVSEADDDEGEDEDHLTTVAAGHDGGHDGQDGEQDDGDGHEDHPHGPFFALEILGCQGDFVADPADETVFGTDPNTGIQGVRWVLDDDEETTSVFKLTLPGNVHVGTVHTGVVHGHNSQTGLIAGPNCDCNIKPVPVIGDPGDIIIGDLEAAKGGPPDATNMNLFVYPDAFNLNDIVSDASTPDSAIKWSFTGGDGRILINGVGPLNLLLPSDDPTSPTAASRIDLNDSDPEEVDGDPFTVTFRNATLSPFGGPNLEPGVDGIVTSQTTPITLFASNCSTFSQRTITVFTANNSSDSISGGGFAPIESLDFRHASNLNAWSSGLAVGAGSAFPAGGLCMTVPKGGDNLVLWASPERFIELVDDTLYRVRVTLTTDQTATDAIPLWSIDYDNFNSSGLGNTFGGTAWFLDVDGGAQGIGRPNGRSQFDVFIAPNAVDTPQWRGQIDFANSAFAPAAAGSKDMRLIFRILDAGSGTVLANDDFGTICIQNVEVSAIPLSKMVADSAAFNAPINTATHFAESLAETGSGGSAFIDNSTGTAHYALAVPDARKTLGPYDASQSDLNRALYPVVWEANTLYRGRLKIRSGVAGPAEGTDPVDVIALLFDTTNNELGQIHWSGRGSAGNMEFAASPRRAEATGGEGQVYTGFFYGQNATSSATPNANRLRFMGDFFNASIFYGPTTGADPFVVESMTVDKMVLP